MVTITCYKTTGRAIHVETGYPPFEISIGGFYAKTDGNIFFVVENRGSKRFSNGQGVPVTEIRVKDGDDGTPESFSIASALMARLRELNYPAFEYENGGGGGSSETNLSYNDATGEVSNDNGDGFTIPAVSDENPGLATPDMLQKQDLQSVIEQGGSFYGDSLVEIINENVDAKIKTQTGSDANGIWLISTTGDGTSGHDKHESDVSVGPVLLLRNSRETTVGSSSSEITVQAPEPSATTGSRIYNTPKKDGTGVDTLAIGARIGATEYLAGDDGIIDLPSGGGGIASIDGANGVTVDDTDPENPVIGLGDITPTTVAAETLMGIDEDYSSGFFRSGGGETKIGDIDNQYNGTILEVNVDDNHINMKSSEIDIEGDVDVTGNLKATTYGTAEVTDTELGYLDGATSNIQNQLTNIFSASVFGPAINALTGKTTPIDADGLAIFDSAASNAAKKLTWANLKATLKAYFDPIYIKGNVRIQGAAIASMAGSSTYYIGGSNNISPLGTSRYKMLFPVNATSFRANLFLYINGTTYGSGESIQVVLHDVTTNTSHTIGNISITGHSQGLLATVNATVTAGNEFEIRLVTPAFSTSPQQVVSGFDIDFF